MRTRLFTLLALAATGGPASAAEPVAVANVNVEKLWASPLGDALRDTPNWLMTEVRNLTQVAGVKPRDVTTAGIALDPSAGFSYEIGFSAPVDQKKLRDAAKGATAIEFPTPNAMRGEVGKGPSPAVEAVKKAGLDGGDLMAVVINPGTLPPEALAGIRKQLSRDYAQFVPLLDSESVRLRLTPGEKGTVTIRLTCEQGDAAKRKQVREALAGALKFAATLRAIGAADDAKPVRGMPSRDEYRKFAAVLKGATLTDTPRGPTLSVTLPGDFAYESLIAATLGQSNPRESARRALQTNNFKQVGLGIYNYESAFATYPPESLTSKDGKPLLSWRVAILPYIGEEKLYKQFKLDEPWDSTNNKPLIAKMPKLYAEPDVEPTPAGTTRVQLFTGNGAMLDPVKEKGATIAAITDGTSNTLMVALAAKPVEWTKPADIPFDPKGDPRKLLHFQNELTIVCMGDGSVRTVPVQLKAEQWRRLVMRADGNIFDEKDVEPVAKK